MTQQEFQQVSSTLPHLPGVYKYYDNAGQLLYVGKAKNIRKRVSSYFNKTLASYKTHELVKRIRKIEFTIVNSEQDAFLLENSLIKQFQPIFNINLKDDKTYPYIVIKNEPFPRVFLTRQKIEDGSQYFGPYTSVGKVRELLNFTNARSTSIRRQRPILFLAGFIVFRIDTTKQSPSVWKQFMWMKPSVIRTTILEAICLLRETRTVRCVGLNAHF